LGTGSRNKKGCLPAKRAEIAQSSFSSIGYRIQNMTEPFAKVTRNYSLLIEYTTPTMSARAIL
jgi:hypothetical protein